MPKNFFQCFSAWTAWILLSISSLLLGLFITKKRLFPSSFKKSDMLNTYIFCRLLLGWTTPVCSSSHWLNVTNLSSPLLLFPEFPPTGPQLVPVVPKAAAASWGGLTVAGRAGGDFMHLSGHFSHNHPRQSFTFHTNIMTLLTWIQAVIHGISRLFSENCYPASSFLSHICAF